MTTLETTAGEVRVGSVVELSSWGGEPGETITVDEVSDDIKGGRPGVAGGSRWAYADQVVRVVTF